MTAWRAGRAPDANVDINAAAEIQQDLLPPRIAAVEGASVAGGVLPGYEVGGDFFD